MFVDSRSSNSFLTICHTPATPTQVIDMRNNAPQGMDGIRSESRKRISKQIAISLSHLTNKLIKLNVPSDLKAMLLNHYTKMEIKHECVITNQ